MGRQVRKGEKGISIFAPVTVNKEVEADNDNGQPETKTVKQLVGFRVVKVFDVEQTDGDTLPEIVTISGDPGESLSRLEKPVAESDIELRYENPGHGALGTSAGGVIRVRPDLSPAERLSVLAHEYGHELLHQGERRHETDKTVRETEAEAVAYAVCRACGIDSKARSSDYIALYRGDPQVLAESLQFIQHTAARIIEGLKNKAA
jgi:antirestriction protein ArdC